MNTLKRNSFEDRIKLFESIKEDFHLLDEESFRYKFLTLNEDVTDKFLYYLIRNTLEKLKRKSKNEDFTFIDKSKGDIDKVKLDSKKSVGDIFLEDCGIEGNKINNLIPIVRKYKQYFENGYRSNNDTIIFTFRALIYSIIRVSTCLLLHHQSNKMLNSEKKLYAGLLGFLENDMKLIDTIIDLENQKKLDSMFKTLLKTGNFIEISIGQTAAIALFTIGAFFFVIKAILITVQSIIYSYYYSKMKSAEYLKNLAVLLEISASNSDNSSAAKKQSAIAEKFRKMADRIETELRESETKARKELKNEPMILDKNGTMIDNVPNDTETPVNNSLDF